MFRRYSSSRRGAEGLAKSVFLHSYCWSITGSRGCVINVFFSSYFEEANNTGEFRHKGWKRGEVLSTLYFLHPCPRDKVGWAGEKIAFLIYVQQISVYRYIFIMYFFEQKLQFAKAEAQKEITSLKSKVSELERKLSAQQITVAKRKRF